MFERVLISTDFADGLHRLAHFVSSLGLAGIKQIVFLHVVPVWEKGAIPKVDTEKIAEAQTQLAAAVGEHNSDVEVKIEVQSGKPVENILKVAQTYQSELIILGSQSRSLFTEKLVGSTMSDLSHQTKIPLLVLRPQLISAYTDEELTLRCQHLFRSLLLPYNNTQSANYLVKQVKNLAEKQRGQSLQNCQLCWVIDDCGRQERPPKILPQQAQATLSQIKADLEGVNLQVKTEVREGNPVNQILETAFMADISAIAVSSETIGKLQEWLVSSFAAEILRQSWYPVIFFPFPGS
ncbi:MULTISPECIES: universal stress protein [unclassified Tolypothrix]|uniref:universal stress protein n=1 Tax=unclassified Tolypothrix TaxID=2649714 RepID=UPI0005EAB695|nr:MULTISPECIES: universal stress protein [unclassified Tolypothrix]BAY88114.1 UspA domain-containing protein [Microchaete diplosiphon NIES-3275]EKE97473.1 putative universal stress protein UspA [Tolypothrix sp. PCC 7601]MBE9086408.1 universal stress protein [Tolypothrix sp. LEGE 11397]UYD28823.1 universal stress protein [Tolypothrix sp. PCC 7712]UYD35265.1 universal stress protein [Tolypothrix sp. PCC 7601]